MIEEITIGPEDEDSSENSDEIIDDWDDSEDSSDLQQNG